ncbi:MAG TPA: prolyl oligopeptidase family serine peptidase [Candidatus Saccharimonadales bacterium]|nr:prolyl oligopeptidase family serine peptidase [Candidatus Saccharimonadales bacterium]
MQQFHIGEYGKRNQPVVLLFGGWTYQPWLLGFFGWLLALRGFYCVAYTYDDDVFSPDYKKTVASLLGIKNAVLEHIEALRAGGRDTFYVVGTSLGTVLATLVANESPYVSKVVLNTTGADVAKSVWNWDRVKPWFKNKLLKQGLTEKDLSEHWKPISPAYNLKNLKRKPTLVYLAQQDQTIPFDQGRVLVSRLDVLGVPYEVVISRNLGHAAAGLLNLLRVGKYAKFLRQE